MTVQLAAPSLALGRYARAIAIGRGKLLDTVSYAEGQREAWRNTPQPLSVLKTAVTALSTPNSGGMAAAAVYNLLLPAIRGNELISRIPGLRQVPLNVTLPAITGDATAYLVAEGQGKPLSKFSLDSVTVSPRKVLAAIILTDELIRFSTPAADTALANELIRAVVVQADRQFANPDFAGSISNGAITIDSTGGTLAAVDHDLAAMMALLTTTGDSALNAACWIMSSRALVYLASLRGSGGNPAFPGLTARGGGSLLGLPVFASSGLNSYDSPSESTILLLDAAQVLVGDSGEAEVSVMKNASVQLTDTPSSTAAQLVSLWQTNMTALLCERWVGWAAQSTSSCVILNNVQFG